MRNTLRGSLISSGSSRALAVVGDVLTELKTRQGFDGWWDALEASARKEIRLALVASVTRRLDGEG